MAVRIKTEIQIEAIRCGECGLHFGIDADYLDELRRNAKTFYCPNGHSRWFGKSEADKLRDELTKTAMKLELAETEAADAWRYLQDEADSRRATERRLSATKGVLTKTRKRVGNGVCPCCNRTFSGLARHMAAKHPDYKADIAETEVAS